MATIYGTSSNDYLEGIVGEDDVLVGYDGNDTYLLNDGADSVEEGVDQGVDTVLSSVTHSLADNVENLTLTGSMDIQGTGNAVANYMVGNAGNNVLNGLDGDDYLFGNAGSDTLNGGNGADRLTGGEGDDTLNGGDGNDWLFDRNEGYGDTGNGNDILNGDTGSDVLFDGNGDDELNGGAGNDYLYAYAGNNALNGNDGDDYLSGADGVDVLDGGSGHDIADGGAGNDTVQGGTGVDWLSGGAGVDLVEGGADDDILLYSAGADTLDGGTGIDAVTYAYAPLAVSINLRTLSVTKGTEADILFSIENAQGSTLNDVVQGDAGDNIMDGEAGVDTVSYSGAAGGVIVNLQTGTATGDGTDILLNFENVIGSNFSDELTGDNGNNALDGGAGADHLQGGIGNDTYWVDNADDEVVEGAVQGADWVRSTVSHTLADNVEHLTLLVAGLTGVGNSLVNYLYGSSGTDTFRGMGGNDVQKGYAGNDRYEFGGGDGQDTVDDSSGSSDVLAFLSGINHDQLWFSYAGTNLVVSVIGTTDQVTVKGIEQIQASGSTLLTANVEALVTAMASMTPPALGQTSLTTAQHAALDTVIAASWN